MAFVKQSARVGMWVAPMAHSKLGIKENRPYLVVATHRSTEEKRTSKYGQMCSKDGDFLFHDDDQDLRYSRIGSHVDWREVSVEIPADNVNTPAAKHIRKQVLLSKNFHDKHRKPKAIPCE